VRVGAGNRAARTAGVDGEIGVTEFLAELRANLKDRTFQPLPTRRRAIPRQAARSATWGSPPSATGGRGVRKLALEPIFEADFLWCSYGFRPGRRPADDVAAGLVHPSEIASPVRAINQLVTKMRSGVFATAAADFGWP
jgi:hypothetical protein